MKLVLVTTLSHIQPERFTSSSERYEYDLLCNLQKFCDFEVVLISKMTEFRGAEPHGYDLPGLKDSYSLLGYKDVFDQLDIASEDIVVFWGYDLRLIVFLLHCRRRHHFKLVNFLYDHYSPAIDGMNGMKRLPAKAYFRTSDYLMRYIDGFILFNSRAYKHIRSNKPCVIVRPCLSANLLDTEAPAREASRHFTVLYAGTLCNYNSVTEILEAFHGINGAHFRLRVYGSGSLSSSVRHYASIDSRIFYGGLVSAEEITQEISSADLVLNIRTTDSIVNDFAFPSKLLEYLSLNRLALSTNFSSDMEDIKDSVYLISDNSATSIAQGIMDVHSATPIEIAEKHRHMELLSRNELYSWKYNCHMIEYFFREMMEA